MKGRTTTIDAKHYRYNPRKISARQRQELTASLDELGDLSGVVYNERSGELVGGNQRSDIFDLDECEIILIQTNDKPDRQGTTGIGFIRWKDASYNFRQVDWDERTEARANIVANKLGGEWDPAILRQHFDVLDLQNWGFKRDELKWLNELREFEQAEREPPQDLGKLYTEPGDIYQLNEHRIICGDATRPADHKKLFRGAMADLVVTDPPYNVAYNSERASRQTIRNDDLHPGAFAEFLADYFGAANEHLKPGGVWYVFHADANGDHFRTEFKQAGNYLAQCLVWIKNNHVRSRSDYNWKHEPIIYGFKPDQEQIKKLIKAFEEITGANLQHYDQEHLPILYGWRKGGAHLWNSDRRQKTVIEYPMSRSNKDHPTMKPVGILEYLINNSSEAGDIVADHYLGAGSTLLAADNLDRLCYAMEIEPRHIDTAIRRWVRKQTEADKPIKVKRNNRVITREKWLYA